MSASTVAPRRPAPAHQVIAGEEAYEVRSREDRLAVDQLHARSPSPGILIDSPAMLPHTLGLSGPTFAFRYVLRT